MRRTTLVTCALVAIVPLVACTAESSKAEAPAPAKPAEAPKTVEPARPAPVALDQGRPIRITGVGAGDAFEITLPPGFSHKVESQDALQVPIATVDGPGLRFFVEFPDDGFNTFRRQKELIEIEQPGTVFHRADEIANGWAFIYKQGVGNGPVNPYPGKYAAVVSWDVKLHCGSYQLDTKQQAEDVVAICLTLKASPGAERAAPKASSKRR